MTSASGIAFTKMNGLGNEIVVVDLRGSKKVFSAAEAQAIAAEPRSHFDQMMVLHDAGGSGADAAIRIYNTDGSAAGACGNGMRCVGLKVAPGGGQLTFDVGRQRLTVDVSSPDEITVDMGEPRFAWNEIPLSEEFYDTTGIELQIGPIDKPVLHSPSVVNVGNPHAVFWVSDVNAFDLGRFGPLLENHPLFPERANISLAHVTSRSSITLRTWERGAGLTRACGSAACAAAVCAARKRLTERTVTVTLPGGDLKIAWGADNRIRMTGPAELEYEGFLELAPSPAVAAATG